MTDISEDQTSDRAPCSRISLRLTRCELEVMEVVWGQEQVTVGEVVAKISRKLAYTTVLTTVRILEEKGILKRGKKVGKAYTYTAAVSRGEIRRSMISDLKEQLFGGSVKSLVMSLIESDSVSPDDVAALREAAEKLESSP